MTARTVTSPRIGILGNMNNLGFVLMRYFRDLGVDAHLLLYDNDGRYSLTHFTPEADTWDIERWRPFIRRTRLVNGPTTAVPDLRRATWPMSAKAIREELGDFDLFVGSGAAPAIFHRAGLRLDLFFPYSTGVEWIGAPEFLSAIKRTRVNGWTFRRLRKAQKAGIRETRHIINHEMGLTANNLNAIGADFERLGIPVVYNGETLDEDTAEGVALRLTDGKTARYRIFAGARVLFRNRFGLPADLWKAENKNSQWIFEGFRLFLDANPGVDARLYVVEYGPDVGEAKALCDDLRLGEHVVWLPKMDRRELRCVVRWCHASLGEFYEVDGIIWGGTGWEALAEGTPFIQRVNFTADAFETTFGHSLPPIRNATGPAQIARHLGDLMDDAVRLLIGEDGIRWFDTFHGRSLARQWLERIGAFDPAAAPALNRATQ